MDNPSRKMLRRFSRSDHVGAIKSLQLMAYSFVSQKKQIITYNCLATNPIVVPKLHTAGNKAKACARFVESVSSPMMVFITPK